VVLTVAVIGSVVWLAVASWPALLPFMVGGLIAYVIRPIVDTLDRFMPRLLAALFGVLAVVAILVGIVVIVVPPLVTGVGNLLGTLPGAGQIENAVDSIEAQLGGPLSPEAHALLVAVGVSATNGLSGLTSGFTDVDLPTVANGIVQTITSIASVVIGLIILPTWILSVVNRHRAGQRAVDRRLAPWLRADFWAIVRILDRAAGAYVHGYVVIAFLVGLFTYLGLTLAERAGVPLYQSKLALAVLAGMLQVIPELGPLLGYAPALLIAIVSPPRAVAYLVVYVASRWVVGTFFGRRIIEARVGVPPAIMVLGVVAISQFGVIWLFVAGPLIAALWDVVRYLHGRLSEPARPAGTLPGEPLPAARPSYATRPVPAYYRPHVQGVVNADVR
jgi:predicted PurR-regulated permease PerM